MAVNRRKLSFDGIEVEFIPHKAKTKAGKDNIWIGIRQRGKEIYGLRNS